MRAKDDFSSLVLRLVQKINLIAHYLFGFASTFPNIDQMRSECTLYPFGWSHFLIDQAVLPDRKKLSLFSIDHKEIL